MAEEKMIRLGQASRKLNVGHNTILEFLAKKGFTVENNPNAKLSAEQFAMLSKEYASSASEKMEASASLLCSPRSMHLLPRKKWKLRH
jgi:translation initiation factor IF-2